MEYLHGNLLSTMLLCSTDRYKWVSETLLLEKQHSTINIDKPQISEKEEIQSKTKKSLCKSYSYAFCHMNNNYNNSSKIDHDVNNCQFLLMENNDGMNNLLKSAFQANRQFTKRCSRKQNLGNLYAAYNLSSLKRLPTTGKTLPLFTTSSNTFQNVKSNCSLECVLDRGVEPILLDIELQCKKSSGLRRGGSAMLLNEVHFCSHSFSNDGDSLDRLPGEFRESWNFRNQDWIVENWKEPVVCNEDTQFNRAKFMASAAEKLFTADRNMKEAQRSNVNLLSRVKRTRSLFNLFFSRKLRATQIGSPVLISSTKSPEYLQNLPEVPLVDFELENVSTLSSQESSPHACKHYLVWECEELTLTYFLPSSTFNSLFLTTFSHTSFSYSVK